MWAILKINNKQSNYLKKDLEKILGDNIIFYKPKISIQKYKKNKLFSKEYSLLGDYIFCFHSKFNCTSNLNLLKFCRGLKYFLSGSISSQNEIKNFILKCKQSEDKSGNITTEFFNIDVNKNYTFKSGPMTDKLLKIIKMHKNKLMILLSDLKMTINKNEHLFRPV